MKRDIIGAFKMWDHWIFPQNYGASLSGGQHFGTQEHMLPVFEICFIQSLKCQKF
jgi:hypothetical protein